MATRIDSHQLTLQDYLEVVKKVSQEVTSSDEASLPSTLLQLLPCLQARALGAKDFSLVKYQVWKEDLIHLIIEVLRNDYSGMADHWSVLTNLTILLSSMLAGFSPNQRPHQLLSRKEVPSVEARAEGIKEYHDIILPTAIDSILILTNSVLEAADECAMPTQSRSKHEDPESLKECFKKTLESLLWVCASHDDCIARVLQSPYFLHILITDNSVYGQASLGVLETLILSNKAPISSIPQSVLASILDELIYKLSGNEEKGALMSLRLLAQLVSVAPEMTDILTTSYTGLLQLVTKWIKPGGPTEVAVTHLVEQIEIREAGYAYNIPSKVDETLEHRSAVVLQSCWRGYVARKKMEKIKRGIRKFQQLYRKRKQEKECLRKQKDKAKAEVTWKQRGLRSSKLAFHEKQLALLEQLPASEFQEYVRRQETEAAIKIQCAWRSWLSRSRYRKQKSEAVFNRSASVIQRALRRNLQQKKRTEQHFQANLLPEIAGAQRDKLQSEIALYRELHPSTGYKSEEDACRLHDKVQKMYEEFYISRVTQSKDDEKAQLHLSQLSRNSDFLSSLPTLEQFVTDPQPDLVDRLLSNSSATARMARRAHREELRVLSTPWWKLPQDHDELTL